MIAKNHHELDIWRLSMELVTDVYRLTGSIPVSEKYGICQQMRRAAVSIPSNIAEGFVKRSIRDKSNFYNMAQGSLEELKYYLILSEDLGYSKNENLLLKADEVGKLLNRLLSSLP